MSVVMLCAQSKQSNLISFVFSQKASNSHWNQNNDVKILWYQIIINYHGIAQYLFCQYTQIHFTYRLKFSIVKNYVHKDGNTLQCVTELPSVALYFKHFCLLHNMLSVHFLETVMLSNKLILLLQLLKKIINGQI